MADFIIIVAWFSEAMCEEQHVEKTCRKDEENLPRSLQICLFFKPEGILNLKTLCAVMRNFYLRSVVEYSHLFCP